MADNRLAGADFIRALACTMVVTHHATQRLDPNQMPGDLDYWLQMGAFGVGAFFVLSGYLLARPFWVALDAREAMPSLRTYALRRAARVLPGYWLALTVSFVLSFAVFAWRLDGDLVFRFISGFALVSDWHWLTFFPVEFNGPLWSISFEVTSYVLLPICLVVLFTLRLRGAVARLAWLALIGLLIWGQSWIVMHLIPDADHRGWQYGNVGGAKFWMPNFNPIGFFAVFAIGGLAAGIQVMLAKYRSIAFDALALAALALAAYGIASQYPSTDGFGAGNIPYGFPWFALGVALLLIAIPGSVLVRRVTEISPVAFVARISFGIYVWHFLIMEIVRGLWVHQYYFSGMYQFWPWALTTTGVVVAAIAVATISYYGLEAPVIRWARGLEHRRTPDSPTLSPAAG